MKSTAQKVTRATRPALVTVPSGWRSTPQEDGVVNDLPRFVVKAEQGVQLESIPKEDGDPGHRWMTWVAELHYSPEREGDRRFYGTNVRLLAEQTDYEVTPATTAQSDITRAIGILTIEELRAVVAGLSALVATLPLDAPFARAAALERGE